MRHPRCMLGATLVAACGGDPGSTGPTCLDPPRAEPFVRFADVTNASGADFQYVTNGFQGGGLAVVDLNGDERPDIVATRRDGGAAVFHNRGALRFSPVADSGVSADIAAHAIAAADLDNDGDRDLVLAGPGVAYVMANRGDGRFDEAARLEASGTTEQIQPVDLDADGLLDLYFSNYDLRSGANTQNRLYMNRGGLQFDVAAMAGGGLTWATAALDVDDDGDQDLYVANDTLLADFGPTVVPAPPPWPVDLLLRNDGPGDDGMPRFTNIAPELGLTTPRSSMGGLVGDFNDDARLDLYVTDLGPSDLLLRDGEAYVERAADLGVSVLARKNRTCGTEPRTEDCLVMSWSAVQTDFDLDGYDELLVVNGETSPGNTPPVLLFTRGAELPYRELSPDLPCMDARGLVATDLDGDGDQDLVIGPANGPLSIYETRGKPARAAWLQVELRGNASNRDGVGAIVTAHLASGRTLVRAVGASAVIHTASPAEAWFGLGSDTVETLAVRWPSGRTTEVSKPAAGATLVVEEP